MSDARSDRPGKDDGAESIHADHGQGAQVGDFNTQDNRWTSTDAGRDAYLAGRDINIHYYDGQTGSEPGSPAGTAPGPPPRDRAGTGARTRPQGPSRLVMTLTGHTGWGFLKGGARGVAFSPDGCQLASAGGDKTVRIWDTTTGAEVRVLTGHTESVVSVAFSPDGHLLASGGGDNTIRVWDTATGAELYQLTGHIRPSGKVPGDPVMVWGVAFSADGCYLASAGDDGTVRVWDTETRHMLRTLNGNAQGMLGDLNGHTNAVHSVTFSAEGHLLASAGGDGTVLVWEAASGALLHKLAGHTRAVVDVAFSPDGRHLASAGADGTVRIWEYTTESAPLALVGHAKDANPLVGLVRGTYVRAVAFSPDGSVVASAGDDGTVRVWEAATGAMLRTLASNKKPTSCVAFSPDGRLLASGGEDNTVRLWT
jgi:WD40 repeat protein